jgi:hypothetical protein
MHLEVLCARGNDMQRKFVLLMLGGATLVQLPALTGMAQQLVASKPVAGAESAPSVTVHGSSPAGDLPPLPPPPGGKSTVFGGAIRKVDPVRDQLTLGIYGEKPLKILFDERTQVYRDGRRVPLRELGLCDHASVQTTLDGASVFALSIHILSQSPQGDYQGRVLSYRPDSGELTLEASTIGEPLKLHVSQTTSIARQGQSAFASTPSGLSDLARGSLISVQFQSNRDGRGEATHIAVLAVPGAAFSFSGDISALDLKAGYLDLFDPQSDRSYRIYFDPAHAPAVSDLHSGAHLNVSVNYDGTRYVANAIATK